MNKDYSFLSLVVPMYREADNIPRLVSEVTKAFSSFGDNYEIILVDDGSDDNSWEILKSLSFQYPRLRSIRLSRNFGQEAAIAAGFEQCRGDLIATMDADLQQSPYLIPKMVDIWKKSDCHLVEGIKTSYGAKVSYLYKFFSWLFYSAFKFLTSLDAHKCANIKVFDKVVLKALLDTSDRDKVYRLFTVWAGFRSEKIEFAYDDRIAGVSQWNVRKLIKLTFNSIIDNTVFPLYLISFFSFISIFLLLIYFFDLFVFIVSKNTFFDFFLYFHLFFIIYSISIIGIYIARIYFKLRGYPRFIVTDFIGEDFRK